MLIDDIYALLGGDKNPDCGVSYGLSTGNQWEELLDTPHLWGHDPKVFDYKPTAINLVDAIKGLVASAQHSVDISTLTPLPDGLFFDAIREGIQAAAEQGRSIVVRILQGVFYPVSAPYIDPLPPMLQFLSDLHIPDNIPVYVGAMQSAYTSWNHSKLVIVDGKRAICGGHNLWTGTYCDYAPVHDVSIQLSGPAIAVAQRFLDRQWTVLAKHSRTKDHSKWYWSRLQLNGKLYLNALPCILSAPPEAEGATRVLALARMGAQLVPPSPSANASRTARIAAAKLAKDHIRISQQMLGGSLMGHFDADFMQALFQHVADRKKLSIIVSDKGASTGSGVPYSGAGVQETARHIANGVSKINGMQGKELAEFLAQYVAVGPVRMYDRQAGDLPAESWKWRRKSKLLNKIEPANHAKVYIIDDEAFYVGSDNAYAAPYNEQGLQEFGFMVSGKQETASFLKKYWAKFWEYSEQFQFTDWQQFAELSQGEQA
ncbi:phospholipase D-like domain-containing protein [Dyella silvatica]|uniref:phospholipase D-like domain-containing protein n=1 Tax=Dyella silvatica TaxID=2992128 RepID=UPI002259B672|nr:phospholipase D-like domain-containing protein [Dyella silvatica]